MVHRFARMIALVLLAWQAVVVQAHGHAPQRLLAGAASVAAHGPARLTAPDRHPDTPADCPLCQEMAHAGQYLSPAPILFSPPAAVPPALASATRAVLPGAARSHFWRSRAPPAPPLS